ncbi:MAG TPA: hypothetical protein VGN36_05865, partial [Sphingorhabdus sp.]|nr:hypothetical protein [Sphingorhabdus sp.]
MWLVNQQPRLSIVADPTVSGFDHPASADAAQISLRAELLGQLVAAQFEIEASMTEIAGNAAAMCDGKAQLQLLAALQRQIGTASPAALAGLRSEIIATVNAAQAVAQHSRAAANDDRPDRAMTAADARQAIAHIGRDIFSHRLLNPYLRFASPEDEEAYRKREEQNRKAYELELAKGTPEGNRRAAEILNRQLIDAQAHGADASPDFADLLTRAQIAQAALDDEEKQTQRSAVAAEKPND